MKKFMIFLLMAFLYLGTCQARSEALHLNGADAKLHSWVTKPFSPSYDASMMAAPAGTPVVTVTPVNPQSISLSGAHSSVVFAAAFDANGSAEVLSSYRWLVDGASVSVTQPTFTFTGYSAGQYSVCCEITTVTGATYRSNSVVVTVAANIIVYVEGPEHSCPQGVVTFTAQHESNIDCSYQWRRDGQYIIGATGRSYSFNVDQLPLDQKLDYQYDVQITRNGCEAVYSPVHYFTVSPMPVTTVDVPLFCTGAANVVATANSYTSGSEQPFKWKWVKDGTTDTVFTYVNYLTIDNPVSGDVYKVIPVYQNSACNPQETSFTLLDYINSGVNPTIADALTLTSSSDKVCLDGMVTLNLADENAGNTALGNITYTWKMNGQVVPGVTGNEYRVALPNSGDYIFQVEASFENYPCGIALSNVKTVTVDAVPMQVAISGENMLCQNADGTYSTTALTAVVTPSTANTVSYKWTGDTDFGTNNTKIFDTPGVKTVIVKSETGCEAMADFTVYAFGSDLQITPLTETSVCPGTPVTLQASATGWTGDIAYSWSHSTAETNATVIVTPTTTTTYIVTASSNGCTKTASIPVTVLNVPAQAPTLQVSADPVCVGDLVNVNVSNHTTGLTYIWYYDGAEIPGAGLLETITYPITEAGAHSFSAKSVSADGCVLDTWSTVGVTAIAAPSQLTITGNNVICETAKTTLTASAYGADHYKWSTGAVASSVEVAAGVYSVTAYATANENSCAVEAEFTVTSFGADIQITAAPSNTVCKGSSVTLNVNAQGWPEGNVHYTWHHVTEGAHSSQITVTPSASGYYYVTSKLSSTAGDCERKDSIYINVIEIPVVALGEITFVDDKDTICEGGQTTIVVNVAGVSDYIWYENGTPLNATYQHLNTVTVSPAAGVYSYNVQVASPEGCVSDVSATTPVTLVVLPNPTIEITGDPWICNDSNVRLVAILNDTLNTTAQKAAYTYEWRLFDQTLVNGNNVVDGQTHNFVILNDTLKTTLTDQDHAYIFTVSATNNNGCVANSQPYNVYIGSDINVAVTLDYDSICKGGIVTATAHLGDYNMPNLTYQWYTQKESEATRTLVPYATSRTFSTAVTEKTKFFVKVTQTTTECTAEGDAEVKLMQDLNLKLVVSNEGNTTGDDFTVCKGEDVYVTATVNGIVDDNLTYVWFENGVLMQGVNGPTFHKQLNILDDDTTSYTYAAYIDYGIEGCEPYKVYSNTVRVRRNPIVTISGNHNVCYMAPNPNPGEGNVRLVAWVDGTYNPDYLYTWYEHNQVRNSAVPDNIYDNIYTENWIPSYDNPYSFTVEVTDANGCTTMSEPFEVNIYSKPEVNITADQTTICKGGEVTLTAHLDNYNDPMLQYQWYKNGHEISDAIPGMTEPVETFAPTASTTYEVKVTHLMNYYNQSCFNIATIAIVVNDDPVVDSITTNLVNNTVCEGSEVQLTAHISGGVPGGEVYTWYRNGQVIEGAVSAYYNETPQANNGDLTTYVYGVSVRQTASDCESDVLNYATITVLPNPVLVITTDPIVCDTLTGNIEMTANVTPAPATDYHFTWYEDNVALTGETGAHGETMVLTRGYRDYAYNFSVELVNEYGCTTRAEATVLVNDNPVVHATVTETDICEGGEITLTANLDDYNANMLEFHWYDGDELIATATELSYTFVPAIGTHRYSMTALQRNSLCIASSDTVVVTVNADPVVTSITTDLDGNDEICEGRYVTMTAHVDGGVTGGEVYTWYRNGEVIEGAVSATYSETPQAHNGDVTTYVYGVSVRQSAAGCESDVVNYSTVTVKPNPVLVLTTDPIVCDTLTGNIEMTANVTPAPATDYHFTWYEDNVALTGETGAHGETMVLTRGYRDYAYNFSVELVNEYGCTTRAEATVLVNDNPVVHATVTETDICEGGEITLTANLDDYNANMLEFHWYDGDELIATATELSYTFVPAIGTHRYSMTALQRNSLCIASSDTVVVTVNVDPIISNVTLSNYTACQGAQIQITAVPENYTPSSTDVYTWYRNGIRIPGATSQTIYDSPVTVDGNTQQFVYTAVVTLEAAGCTSEPVSANALTIYANPVVAISGDQHVCETDYTFLIANVDTTGMNVGNLHYTWYINGAIRDNMAYNLGDSRFFAEYLYPQDEPYIFTVHVERGDVANACGATSAPFEVYVSPVPDVTVVQANDIHDVCVGGEVTLEARLDNYNTEDLMFQWYELRTSTQILAVDYLPNGGYVYDTISVTYKYNIPGATLPFLTAAPSQTTTFGVTVTQTTTLCTATSEYNINVHALPAAPVVTVSDAMICSAADVDFNVTNDYSEYGVPTYTWYQDRFVIPSATQATFHQNAYAMSVGVHNYTVIASFDMPGCVSAMSDAAIVKVIENPTVEVYTTDPTSICEGGVVNFHAVVTHPTEELTYSYAWIQHNAYIEGANTADLTISPEANTQDYIYTVEVSSLPGCTVTATTDNYPVTVVTDPRVTLSIDHNAICENGQATMTVNVEGGINDVNGIDPYTYTWYNKTTGEFVQFDATNVNTMTVPTMNYIGSIDYKVDVTAAAYGCASTTNSVNIIVHETPAAPVVTVSDAMVCAAADVDFNVTNDYSEYGVPTYTWYQDRFVIPEATMSNFHQNANTMEVGIHNYTVVASFDMPGCVSPVSDNNIVEVIENPTVNVYTTDPTSICEGGVITFNAVVTHPTQNLTYTYAWSEHDTVIAGANTNTLTISPEANTQDYIYTVEVSSLPGCTVTATTDNYPVTVVTDPRVTLSIDNSTICEGGEATLTANIEGGISDVNGINPYTFKWFNNTTGEYVSFDETNVNTLTVSEMNNIGSIDYKVEVSALTYGCASTSNVTNLVVVADPVVNIAVAQDAYQTVCNEGFSVLVANVQGGVGTNSYEWFKDGVGHQYNNAASIETGILYTTDANNFVVNVDQTGSGCSATASFQMNVVDAYQVAISSVDNRTDVCQGGTVTMQASLANQPVAGDQPVFTWYKFDNEIYGTNNNMVYTTSPSLSAGEYEYHVVVSSDIPGCSATSGSITTAVFADPVVRIVSGLTQNATTICEGADLTLTAEVVPSSDNAPQPTYTYSWSNNGTAITGNTASINPVLTPSGSTPYRFYVTITSNDNTGCNATSEQGFAVEVVARPQVNIIPDHSSICAGGTVNLTASHTLIENTQYNYQWVVNGQTMPQFANTISYDMNNVGAINAQVTVSSSNTLINCTTVSTLSTPVQVVAAPTVTVSAAHATMCEGAAAELTSNVTTATGVNAPVTYQWLRNATNIAGATSSSYTDNALNAGAYSYSLAVSQGDVIGCTSVSAPVVVRVAERPVVMISSEDGLDLCQGGDITLTANVTNVNNNVCGMTNGQIYGSYDYTWTSGSNTVVTNSNIAAPTNQITQTLNTIGSFDYNVSVKPVGTMAYGCVASQPYAPFTVNVNARPTWTNVNVDSQDGNICLGERINLSANIVGGVVDMNNNPQGYIQWVVTYNNVTSNVAGGFGPQSFDYPSEAGTYVYTPTYVGNILGSGCTFANGQEVATTVTVHALPTAEFVSGNDTTLCANVSDASAALTIHFTGTPPFTFVVENRTTGTSHMYVSNTNEYTIYVSPAQTTHYTITQLADEYCSNGDLGLTATATVFVNDITFDEEMFMAECGEDVVTISFNMISGTPNSAFTVTYENGQVETGFISNGTATFATPNVPGDYNAVFNVGGCDYNIIVRRPVNDTDFSTDSVPFMMTRWDDVVIINNNPATNGGHHFISYQWYKNGELIPGAIYKNYQEVGGLNGYYSVEVVSKDEATGETVTYRTCEQFFAGNSAIRVYPVPANIQQEVTVEIPMTAEELEGAVLDIYDVTGSLVNHITKVQPVTKVSGFKAQGTYFGRVTTADNTMKTVKFIIVK